MSSLDSAPLDHKPMVLAGTLVFLLLGWLMPLIYLLVLWQAKLKDVTPILPLHLSTVPWKEPFVAVLLGLSLVNLIGVYAIGRFGLVLVRRRIGRGVQDCRVLILAVAIIGACLLEAVCIYGLVLSFAMRGKDVLPLTLILMAAAPVGHLVLWPWPSHWQCALDTPFVS